MKVIIQLLTGLLFTSTVVAGERYNLEATDSRQVVVVTTSNWDINTGKMVAFEKHNDGWKAADVAGDVTIGRTGLAWGLGLHPKVNGHYKKEGDGKAPAGIFELGDAFGQYDTVSTGLSYQQLDKGDFCIDVKGNPLYNQTVNVKRVGEEAIKGSSEPMRRDLHTGDNLYSKGIFVKHNPDNISGEGSCIFVHVWRGPGKPTAGCTAMDEKLIDQLLAWLDKDKKPLFVVLPHSEYMAKQKGWKLPQL